MQQLQVLQYQPMPNSGFPEYSWDAMTFFTSRISDIDLNVQVVIYPEAVKVENNVLVKRLVTNVPIWNNIGV